MWTPHLSIDDFGFDPLRQVEVALGKTAGIVGRERESHTVVADRDVGMVVRVLGQPRDAVQEQLTAMGYGEITTEIAEAGPYYFAESYHQQYLAKNPNGYCGISGTGVSCPTGITG